MNRTPLHDEPPLAAALRACADGFYPAEAAAELLIGHASWLYRDDFRDGYVDVGTSITDSITVMATIDWPAAIAALDNGGLPAAVASGEYCGSPRAWPTAFPSTCMTRSPEWTRPTSTEPSARCSTPRDARPGSSERPGNQGVIGMTIWSWTEDQRRR